MKPFLKQTGSCIRSILDPFDIQTLSPAEWESRKSEHAKAAD